MKKLNILFICKSNIFRSKVAEAYFKKINKNKKLKVTSAGIFMRSSLQKEQAEVVKEMGINIKGKSRSMTSKMIRQQDIIINVANDIPKSLFNKTFMDDIKFKGKVINWDIKDIAYLKKGSIKERTKITINQIIKKVDKLNKDIEKGKIK